MKRYMDLDMKDFNNGFIAFHFSFTFFSLFLSLSFSLYRTVCEYCFAKSIETQALMFRYTSGQLEGNKLNIMRAH